MHDIVLIIAIILEIVITSFALYYIQKVQRKIECLENKMLQTAKVFQQASEKLKTDIIKLNKFITFFTNKRFILVKNIILYSIQGLKLYFLFNSFKTFKGAKTLNFKNLKKILITKMLIQLLKKAADKC